LGTAPENSTWRWHEVANGSPPQLRRSGAKRRGGAGQTIQFLDQHHPSLGFAEALPSSAEEGSPSLRQTLCTNLAAVRLITVLGLSLLFATLAFAAADLSLADAIQRGDNAAVRQLLQNHADVNATQPDGSTPLLLAVDRNNTEVVELLVRAGANVRTANEYGATALSVASTRGNTAIIKMLLDAKADPDAALLSGETPLMSAVDKGNVDAARLLLDAGANANVKESKGGQTALMWAASGKQPEIVKLLVEHGADVRARSKGDFSALLFAAQQGDSESGRILLAAGAGVNDARKRDGMTALMLAVAGGHTEFSALLLDKGANPTLTEQRGYTALHFAALNASRLELVKALLAHGANPNARTTKDSPRTSNSGVSFKGATPLFFAASVGNFQGLRALVAGGADPYMKTDSGTAPLQVATWGGNPYNHDWTEDEKKNLFETTKVLVELGADVNEAGEHRWTALHGAAYKGVDSVVQYLVEHGAKMDVFDEYGQTPLSIADAVITVGIKDYYYQSSRVVRKSTSDLLLKLGATPLEKSGVQVLDLFYKER
jgi:ankyrin repeat protein